MAAVYPSHAHYEMALGNSRKSLRISIESVKKFGRTLEHLNVEKVAEKLFSRHLLRVIYLRTRQLKNVHLQKSFTP